jgi:hypothetical protein
MVEAIPNDVIDYVRDVFGEANREATMALARQPAAHEEQLDFQIFAALDKIGPRSFPGSGAAIEIDTHWLGGRRHFERRWEIADIGVVIALRVGGKLVWRKVALLQSKRLYSREIPVSEMERADYGIGIGRLVDRVEALQPLTQPRAFRFTPECVYGAMRAGDEQSTVIDRYMRERRMPVYYSFYNPPDIPYEGTVPRVAVMPLETEQLELGCRVMRAIDVHMVLRSLPIGSTPQFGQIRLSAPAMAGSFGDHGWRLESFIADEVLRCREGRRFDQAEDSDLHALLYLRDYPISSLIHITVDLPEEGGGKPKGRRIIRSTRIQRDPKL